MVHLVVLSRILRFFIVTESDHGGAVVVANQDIGRYAADEDRMDMANLAFDGQSIDRRGCQRIMALIEQDRAIVGIVTSHLNIIVVKITYQ